MSQHKKWSFSLRISSVNVIKSAVSCKFGHIYWRNASWKTSFFVQCVYTTIRITGISSRGRNSWKVFDSATTTLMISNKEMEDILKIVKSFEDSGLFIRGATKAIENETKE